MQTRVLEYGIVEAWSRSGRNHEVSGTNMTDYLTKWQKVS